MKNLFACALVLGACFPVMAQTTLCPQYVVADYGMYKYYFANRCPPPGGAYYCGDPNLMVPTGPCETGTGCVQGYEKKDKPDAPSPKFGASKEAKEKGVKKGSKLKYQLGIVKQKNVEVGILSGVGDPFIAQLEDLHGGKADLIEVHVLVFAPFNEGAAVIGALAHRVATGSPVATATQNHGDGKEWHFKVDAVPGTMLKNLEGQIIREEN